MATCCPVERLALLFRNRPQIARRTPRQVVKMNHRTGHAGRFARRRPFRDKLMCVASTFIYAFFRRRFQWWTRRGPLRCLVGRMDTFASHLDHAEEAVGALCEHVHRLTQSGVTLDDLRDKLPGTTVATSRSTSVCVLSLAIDYAQLYTCLAFSAASVYSSATNARIPSPRSPDPAGT